MADRGDHPETRVESAATTEGLPVSPSLGPTLTAFDIPPRATLVDRRVVFLCAVAMGIAVLAAFIARLLVHLIGLVTNLAFYGRFDTSFVSPANHQLGLAVVFVPVLGGLIVGLMARYGSKAIRGHGIPEAMEQVLMNQSRIPPRITFLKPISAAISIGTGGPFGAEGPIIATGGALGSLIGQLIPTTADERKTLLTAGAAAGMAATFGSPVSAVLLAMELLLFEFRPRSLVPVALASVTAASIRAGFEGVAPVFPMPDLAQPGGTAMAVYILLGLIVGVVTVPVVRAVYRIEDAFERLPIHWMWWPALGAVVVGAAGYLEPRSLGVGYDNISDIISDRLPLQAVFVLCAVKFVSWSVSLGSGTSGGTLAPLFTFGSGLGALLGAGAAWLLPHAGIDVRITALVGMAALFAGASRALLASIVFAFETTLQPLGLLPLLGGCTASFLMSALLMQHSIMTEKIVRRGVKVPVEYAPDFLGQVLVREVGLKPVVTLRAEETLAAVHDWLRSGSEGTHHQGLPVVDGSGVLLGVVTRRDLLAPEISGERRVRELVRRPPVVIHPDSTLREAADQMVRHGIGRLPVVSRESPGPILGILTRSDLLAVQERRLEERHTARRTLALRWPWRAGPEAGQS